MMLETYPIFFKRLILRKKTDLLNPKFHPVTDIRLPRNSLFVFIGKDESVIGPDVNEQFIGNYTQEINVEFMEKGNFPIGRVREMVVDRRKLQINYFKGHYRFTRVRNPDSMLRLEKQLYVMNFASAMQGKRYVANKFVNFEKAYNRFATLMHGTKEAVNKSHRNVFLHLELPPALPGWQRFLISFNAYKDNFGEDKPEVITNKSIEAFKDYGCYWLMDFFAFLLGKYKYSLFSVLTDEEMARVNIILTYNSKALLINLGKLKEWFDETSFKKKSENPRVNATKRFMLALITLINDGSTVSSTKSEDILDVKATTEEEEQETEAGEFDSPHEGKGQEETDEKVVNNHSTLDDLFAEPEKPAKDDNQAEGTDGSDRDNAVDSKAGREPTDEDQVDGNDDEPTPEIEEEWTDDVDDSLLEETKVVESDVESRNVFVKPESGIERALDERVKNGGLTVAERNFYIKKSQSYKTIEMPNGQTVENFIKITPEEIKSLDGTIKADIPTLLDKSMLKSKATELKLGYIEKFLQKDVVNSILSIQNAGICVTGLEIEEIVNAEGAYIVYRPKLLPVDGSASTPVIRFPRVDKDGTFTVDGVKQVLETAKMEIPIRKINEYTVALTSYYDRKLMVTRSQLVSEDYGAALAKKIKGKACNEDLTFVLGKMYNKATKAPRYYSMLASKFKSISTNGFNFEFDIPVLEKKFPDLKKFAKPTEFPCGEKDGKLLLIDQYGNVEAEGKSFGTFEEIIGLPANAMKKMPLDIVKININGVAFPIGVVLCYYFGIDQLIKVLKLTPTVIPIDERLNITDDEFAIAFSDEYLAFNRRDLMASYIFGGLRDLPNISNFSRFDLNNPGVWIPIMGNPKVRPSHFAEMKLLFDMFIDHVTKEWLEERNYPVDFHYLLIEAVEMLTTDYSKHEVAIDEQRFVGYERFHGHLYREQVKAIRQFRSRGGLRGNKIDINPEAVITNIITDTSVNLVEEVNPVHEIKTQEEVTFGGTGGRSEDTMVRRTRGQQENFVGIVSEAGKDSGKVGFIHYMTSDPKIVDYRGNVDLSQPTTPTGLFSVVGNLMYGSTKDDPKRALFTGTQASQVMAATNYTANCLRTGYDTVLAHRTSELYSKPAKRNGTVTKLDKYGLSVVYDDGTEDSYPLGLYIGEAAGEKHRHTRVTDLKVGDTFKEGEILGWDEQFFERDLANPRQVVWKCGAMVRVSLTENQFTFEDSFKISQRLADNSRSFYIKPKRFIADFSDAVVWKKKIGDAVDYEEILCEVEGAHIADIEDEDPLGEFDGLDRMGAGLRQIKANHHGNIVRIETTYNGSVQDMSPSLQELVGKCNKERVAVNRYTKSGVVNGDIGDNSSVKKIPINPGKVLITIYVEELVGATTADKFVLGNQMKGTTSYIFKTPIYTIDGREIDVQFSCKSMYKRMVVSLRDKMCVIELAFGVTQQFVNLARS